MLIRPWLVRFISKTFWKTLPRFLNSNNLLNLFFWIVLQEKMGRKYCWWLSLLSLAQRRVYCWICELSHTIQWTFLHLCQLSKSWVKKRWNCKPYWTGDRREILKLVNKAFILCAEQYYNTMEAFIPWYTLCIALPPFTENITLGYMNENRLEI